MEPREGITFVNIPFNKFIYKRTNFLGGSNEYEVDIDTAGWEVTENFQPNSAAILELIPI